jgi:hypothetical protein
MAKETSRINVIKVGATNPPATVMLNKSTPNVDGPKQITDDTTTDDSGGPEHATVYPCIIESIVVEQLVDTADASYIFLLARAEDGATCFVAWQPEGAVSTKRQYIFQATVHMKPKRDTKAFARVEWTLKATGAATPSAIP